MAKSWCVFEKRLFFFFLFKTLLNISVSSPWPGQRPKIRIGGQRPDTWIGAWRMLTFLRASTNKCFNGNHSEHKDSSRLPLVLRKERCDDTVRRSCTHKVSSKCRDRRRFFPETLTDKPEIYRPLWFSRVQKKKRPLAAAQVRRWCRVQGSNW